MPFDVAAAKRKISGDIETLALKLWPQFKKTLEN
jgi:hypothetical protein